MKNVLYLVIALSVELAYCKEPQEILQSAINFSEKASFKTYVNKPWGYSAPDVEDNAVLYRFVNEKGDIFIRCDIIFKNKKDKATLLIRNNEHYQITYGEKGRLIQNSIKSKTDFTNNGIALLAFRFKDFSRIKMLLSRVNCSYSTIPSYDNSCIQVKLTIPHDDQSIARILAKDSSYVENYKEQILQHFPVKIVFLIKKYNPLILKQKFYNIKGQMIYQIDLGKLDFHEKISEALFALPHNMQVENVRNQKELTQKYFPQKSFFARSLEAFMNIGHELQYKLELIGIWILQYGGTVALIIAILLIPIIIYLKRQAQK